MSKNIRVAAAQFHVANDVNANLDTCLRAIRGAAAEQPDLLVLPEFSNHCSWYEDGAHCYEVSVDIDGEFLAKIADAVREVGCHVVINCTVRRDGSRVTGTSLLYGPSGELLGTTDKQVLIGHENDFLDRASEPGPIIDTPIGRLAMYSCMDGVINETPRCLALRGAQVLCNSLNSFAVDEGSLHIPVRAAENKVWVVAANKVGPLIPEALVGPVSQAINIPANMLDGAGDSQIVAPDGRVLAMAGKGEETVFADIDVSLADDKRRPDGTDVFASRRPELYARLGEDPQTQDVPETIGQEDVAATAIAVASRQDALAHVAETQSAGSKLICLPALCGIDSQKTDAAIAASAGFAEAIAAILEPGVIVATSLVEEVDGTVQHSAVLISRDGVQLRQAPLHRSERYGWSSTGDSIEAIETPQGRIAVVTSDDALYPETFRLLALSGVNIAMVPASVLEQWELTTGIVERAAENRINVVLASSGGETLIASLQKDFTIMTEWENRDFDGLLSCPEVVVGGADDIILTSEIHPLAAANKECSRNTHLVSSRPWNLLDAITS